MTRQRNGKSTKSSRYPIQLRQAIAKLLPQRGLRLISSDRRVRWTDRLLTIGGILVAWGGFSTMLDRIAAAQDSLAQMYPTRRRVGRSDRGFLKALATRTEGLLAVLRPHLRRKTIAAAGSRWRWKRWVVLAGDGSRVACARTVANEAAFGLGGREKGSPQQWVTSIFHVETGLLWDYRRGKATDSERTHLREMLADLPERALLLLDAGFTGFELLQQIDQSGRSVLVRAGANVTLLEDLYDVREDGATVWLWPKDQQGQSAPLKLRKLSFVSHGRPMCLLTNVASKKRLSDKDMKDLYRQRWMIEVKYRDLKQTMGRRKLVGTSPAVAQAELDWSMIGLWLLGLMQVGSRRWRRSVRFSYAQGLRVVRRAMTSRARPSAGGLIGQLRRTVLDTYERHRPKKARDWPHKKKDPPCGHPIVRTATHKERLQAQAFHAPHTQT